MTVRKGFPSQLSGVGAAADDMRYNLAGLVVRDATGVPRSGIFPPATTLLASTGTMNIAVAAFAGFAVRDGGPVFLANDGTSNVLLANAPASNSRLDVVYAKQDDMSSTVTTPDGDNLPVLGVLQGIAAPSPVRNPAGLPAGALELGTVLVPSTATNTGSAGVVISQTFQYTCMAGGLIMFRNSTDRGTFTPQAHQQGVMASAPLVPIEYNGTSWQKHGLIKPTAQVTTGGTSVINDDGSITSTFTGAGTLTLQNCFLATSVYDTDDYDIEISGAGSASTYNMKMASGGTVDPATTTYDTFGQTVSQAGTATAATILAAQPWFLNNNVAGVRFEATIEMRHPALAVKTSCILHGNNVITADTSKSKLHLNLDNNANTAWDGLQLAVSAACVVTTRIKPRK